MPTPLIMTKCHLLLFLVTVLSLPACKPSPQGPSLSEYGARSEATARTRFESYVAELHALPREEAFARQENLMRETDTDSARWQQIVRLQEVFLMDPDSPYRSEELFIPVLDAQLASPLATEEQRLHAAWRSPRIRLNRPGTPAADFAFTTRDGRPHTLYEVIDRLKPDRTLLFFSNPGCANCKELTEALAADPLVRAHIADGRLLVISLYPDADLQAWFDSLSDYPEEWICGYDPDGLLLSDTVYWLRAIPSLYLIDGQKRVVLKDAPLQRIIAALSPHPAATDGTR